MGRTVAFIVVLAVVLGGIGFVLKDLDGQVKRLKFEAERAELKEKFAARVPHIAMADAEHANFDLVQAFKAYKADIDALYKKYPGFKPGDALKRYEKDYKDKKVDEQKMRGIKERVELTKKVWQSLTKGEYKAVATSADKSIRMDIYDITRSAEGGEDKLFVNVLIFNGVPDKGMNWGQIKMEIPLEDDEATAKARKAGKLVDQKAERKAEVTGGGEPNTLINEPDRWYDDFPPGMMIAYYNFPMFPGEAKEMDLTFEINVKNPGGGMVPNNIKYKLPIQESWKLPKGTSFGADEASAGGGDED